MGRWNSEQAIFQMDYSNSSAVEKVLDEELDSRNRKARPQKLDPAKILEMGTIVVILAQIIHLLSLKYLYGSLTDVNSLKSNLVIHI